MRSAFQIKIDKTLYALKKGKKTHAPPEIISISPNTSAIKIFVITEKLIRKPSTIKLLASWREKSNEWFPSQFQVTLKGTKKWAVEQLLSKKDRILFFLQREGDRLPFAHAGFYRFDYEEKSCELDNIIRGRHTKETKGGMTTGIKKLIDWAFSYLDLEMLYLRVFSDNTKAIALYKRLGFEEIKKIPLKKVKENNIVNWQEKENLNVKADRYNVQMRLKK